MRRGDVEIGDTDVRSQRASSGFVFVPCPKEFSTAPQWDLAIAATAFPMADDFGFGRGEARGVGVGRKKSWGGKEEEGRCS